MITIDDIEKSITILLHEDKDLVHTICTIPFEFTEIVMKNKQDTRSILFNKLFKFSLKSKYL